MDYYSKNDIFCFFNCSFSEGLPVSIMEAMSFGIPCVATNVGGVSELVDDSNGKLLHPNPTISEIESEICHFLQLDEKKYEQKRLSSRKKWLLSFCSDTNYNNWYDILTEE